jgi:nucleotidyltransferase AbiEii toxin of type IV toxin-antitoxin system
MTKTVVNVPASVRARLLRRAKELPEDFSLLLQRYAAERFLYRLSQTPHRSHFVLKGAMLFAVWDHSLYRSTRDLDLAGFGSLSRSSAGLEACQGATP